MSSAIALLTDFGDSDHYAGTMRGVILSIARNPVFATITNHVPRGDINEAAYQLWASYRYFPERTVFLCVVDPGVGSSRHGIIAEVDDYTFIAPDNGLLSYVLEDYEEADIHALENPDYQLTSPSRTFHGRDLFAPAAAYALKGVPGEEFGQPIQPRRLPGIAFEPHGTGGRGRVVSIDIFGNVITSLPGKLLEQHPQLSLHIKGHDIATIVSTFTELDEGAIGLLEGSSGLIEVVCNLGSAARDLNVDRGCEVQASFG